MLLGNGKRHSEEISAQMPRESYANYVAEKDSGLQICMDTKTVTL